MNKYIITKARSLRKKQTDAEVVLWSILRNRKFNNVKFRRQYPIGRYIVDFCSVENKLVIEIDGSGHNIIKQKQKDEIRGNYIKSKGYRILRIWNNDLVNNKQGVLEAIYQVINN